MPSTRIAYFAILITNLEIIFGSGKDMGEKLLNLQIEKHSVIARATRLVAISRFFFNNNKGDSHSRYAPSE